MRPTRLFARFAVTGAACGVALLAFAKPAGASVIGINIANDGSSGETLGTSDVAGVSTVQQDNWNNLVISNPDGNGYGNGGNLTTLTDSTGATVAGMNIYAGGSTYLANTLGFYNSSSAQAWGADAQGWGFGGTNLELEQGMIYHLPEITVQNVPYANYDVYVYYAAGYNGGAGTTTMSVTQGATGAVDADSSQTYTLGWENGNFVLGANYLIFQGNTASSFTLDNVDPNGWNTGIAGIQIVAVPEPASLALLGLGFAALLGRRRRQHA